jgi:hypothetical protein
MPFGLSCKPGSSSVALTLVVWAAWLGYKKGGVEQRRWSVITWEKYCLIAPARLCRMRSSALGDAEWPTGADDVTVAAAAFIRTELFDGSNGHLVGDCMDSRSAIRGYTAR